MESALAQMSATEVGPVDLSSLQTGQLDQLGRLEELLDRLSMRLASVMRSELTAVNDPQTAQRSDVPSPEPLPAALDIAVSVSGRIARAATAIDRLIDRCAL